jgi:hypothetical protein
MLQFESLQIIPDRNSETFACLSTLQVLLFDTSSSSPLERFSLASEASSACLIPNTNRATLVVIDTNYQVHLLGDTSIAEDPISAVLASESVTEQPTFSALFGPGVSATQAASTLVAPQLVNTALTTASSQLMQPSHVAPSVDRLLRAYLGKLLPSTHARQQEAALKTQQRGDVELEPMQVDHAEQQAKKPETADEATVFSLLQGSTPFSCEVHSGWGSLLS